MSVLIKILKKQKKKKPQYKHIAICLYDYRDIMYETRWNLDNLSRRTFRIGTFCIGLDRAGRHKTVQWKQNNKMR